MQPETKYARLGDDRIAYQVLGHGPPDLVLTFGVFSSVDLIWEDPGLALFHRLSKQSRLPLAAHYGACSVCALARPKVVGARRDDPPPCDCGRGRSPFVDLGRPTKAC